MRIVSRPSGLHTAAARYGGAPLGGLTVADNVTLRRPGVLEPRPGFTAQGSGPINGELPAQAFEYNRKRYTLGQDGVTIGQMGSDVTVTLPYPVRSYRGVQAPVQTLGDASFGVSADNHSAYIFTEGGTYALREVDGDVSAVEAGLAAPVITFVSTQFSPIRARAFRCVLMRKVGNFELRSAPSERKVSRVTGGPSTVDLSIRIPFGAVAGDVVEVYASELTTTASTPALEPSDEMALLQSNVLLPGDITAGTKALTATLATLATGASLYTNESQEGILQGNALPPPGVCSAAYGGSMFFGNVQQPERLEYQNQSIGTTELDTIVYVSSTTFTYEFGTPFTLLKPGDVPVAVSHDHPAGTYVVSVTGSGPYTVTLSEPMTGTTVSDEWSPSARLTSTLGTVIVPAASLSDLTDPVLTGVEYLSTYDTGTGRGVLYGPRGFTLGLSEAFTVSVPHTVDGPYKVITPTSDVLVGAVYWSKNGQFESVPLVNFVNVGQPSSAVIGMAAAENALYIFKEDGVFSLTGFSAETGWSTQPLSDDILIHTNALTVVGGAVYAWTGRGLMEFTASSARNLSILTVGDQLRPFEDAYLYSENRGDCYMQAFHSENELVLGLPETPSAGPLTQLYVYNPITDAWTRWTRPLTSTTEGVWRCLGASRSYGILLGTSTRITSETFQSQVWTPNRRSEAPFAADNLTLARIGGVGQPVSATASGTTVTITFGQDPDSAPDYSPVRAPFLPTQAHVLLDGQAFRIVSVDYVELDTDNPTSTVVLTVEGSPPASASVVAYGTIPEYTIRWAPHIPPEGHDSESRFREGMVLFDNTMGLSEIEAGVFTPEGGVSLAPATFNNTQFDREAQKVRFWVPRAGTWSWGLEPQVVISGGGNTSTSGLWGLSGLSMEIISSTPRLRRT